MSSFDPKTTVVWENIVKTDEGELLIFLPFTKTSGFKGFFLDIFPMHGCNYCPVKAIVELEFLCKNKNFWCSKKPVFTLESGKLLTVQLMNKILLETLHDFCDEKGKISCHSFRAAIPTIIASHPDKNCTEIVKEWGRWNSDCFKRYTKDERAKKKVLFYKIVSLLE